MYPGSAFVKLEYICSGKSTIIMVDFKGKTALITGAGSGIGEALACRFASEGADVMLVGRNTANLGRVGAVCEKSGVKVRICAADLAEEAQIDALVEYIREEGVRPDVIVLNAGVSQRARTFDSDFSVDRRLMQVNYMGNVYLIKKLKDIIMGQKVTRIAVNTSIAGLFGFPMRSAYSASKHALFGFFESLALEYDNIKVTFLVPGRINTGISNSALLGDGSAYGKMDPGQAGGLDVNLCAGRAFKAIAKGRRKVLIGKSELLMAYIYKWLPGLYFRLSKRISAV